MHKKSAKPLKTTHKEHKNKHTDCPAQMVVKLLTPKKHDEFCVDVILKHTHNHLVDVADALRFRPVSKSTKENLFRQGHSPSSAHLEYETHLTYMDGYMDKLLADRKVNPKIIICLTSGENLANSCLNRGSMPTMMLTDTQVERQVYKGFVKVTKQKVIVIMINFEGIIS